MKKLRKIMCLFLSVLMILSINVPAFAVENVNSINNANEETNNNKKPLSIEVSTDKEKYKTLGIAKITATVTNISDEDIQNVSAEAVFTDLAPVGKKSDTKKEVETLKAGESISFTYNATINKNEYKLNIFQKLFLLIIRIFKGGFTATDNGFDNGREYISTTSSLTFGNFSANNEVKVWYGEDSTKFDFTEQELDEMEKAEIQISVLLNSADYQNGDENYRKNEVQKLLQNLSADGLINSNSIEYDDEYKQYYFLYSNGVEHYICIEKKDEINLLPKEEQDDIKLLQDEYEQFFKNVSTKSKSTVKYEQNNAIFTYGATGTYNPENNVDMLNRLGLKTTYAIYPTVEEYKTILLGYDMIIIYEHGAEFFNKNKIGLVLSEKITKDKNKQYADDLFASKKRIVKYNDSYCILPEFFNHYYSNSLNNTFVQLISCNSVGRNGRLNYNLAMSFESCGALGELAFHNSVGSYYAATFSKYFTYAMFLHENSKEAFDYACDKAGKDEYEFVYKNIERCPDEYIKQINKEKKKGIVAYPDITSFYANPFNYGSFSITVKDTEKNNPISEANIKLYWIENDSKLYDNNSNNHFEYNVKTNENGVCSDYLPIGYYKCEISKTGYLSNIITINIEKDGATVLTEPILLTSKGSSGGGNEEIPSTAIEFNGHYYQIYDESITWTEAKEYCENLGGHLVTITTQEENDIIISAFDSMNYSSKLYYIGATRQLTDPVDAYSWTTGESFNYNNFYKTEPNNYWGNENCLAIINKPWEGYLKRGEWVDEANKSRTQPCGFICEWDTFKDMQNTTAKGNCITDIPVISFDRYTGNQGDSSFTSLDGLHILHPSGTYHGYTNIGIDGKQYNNGFCVWIARWNFGDKISWAQAKFDLSGKYQKLQGNSTLLKSNNTTNFDTSVYFYNGDDLLYSFTMTQENYNFDFSVDVTGVDELTILVKDNKETARGTSFALYDMFLT